MTALLPETRVRTYVIEPQTTFVGFLERALHEAGLDVIAVSPAVDTERIAAADPDAVIVDVDFLERGGPSALCAVRSAVPGATILAYTDDDDESFSAMDHRRHRRRHREVVRPERVRRRRPPHARRAPLWLGVCRT